MFIRTLPTHLPLIGTSATKSTRARATATTARRIAAPVAAAVTVALTLAGCDTASSSSAADNSVVTSGALPEVLVIDSEVATTTSATLFASSPVDVVAPRSDATALHLAAAAALLVGVPLLTVGDDSSDDDPTKPPAAPSPSANPAPLTQTGQSQPGQAQPSQAPTPTTTSTATTSPTATAGAPTGRAAVSAEIARLGAQRVVAIGTVGELELGGSNRIDVASEPGAVNTAIGGHADIGAAPKSLADVAEYQPATPTDGGPGRIGPLPSRTAEPLDATSIVTNDDGNFAAAVTARAAGARVVVQDAEHDLLADQTVITALSETARQRAGSAPQPTVLIGAGFAAQPDPTWSVRAARGGYQLPGGGQRLFDDHLFVALYGTPGTPVLGVLGEQGATETVARAVSLAAEYSALSKRPVVPTLEIIATVAAADAGDDGNYSNEIDHTELTEFVDAASAAGVYVVLDLQPGRSDFLSQATQYQALLERPNVGLALDPEWRLGPDQLPLEQIGSVDAGEINRVSAWLAALVTEKSLPPKAFVLHEFRGSMIADRTAVTTTIPQLEFLMHVDGQGSQPDKRATYEALVTSPPNGVAVGWKNFIDEDSPMLSPAETMAQVRPLPDFISYQ